MCLILLAWKAHPRFPLVVAANRDEFFARPTASAGFWDDASQVLAGRDLEASGTWLGITRAGRFAALTNYRDPARNDSRAPSRGALVARFLTGDETPAAFERMLAAEGPRYNGFNLVFGECAAARAQLRYFSNCGDRLRTLAGGIYGLSNHLLDTPWPKVSAGKSALARALSALPAQAPLFELLRDEHTYPDDALPRTGVSQEWERLLSASFIRSPDYGTRSSTVLIVNDQGEARFIEQTFLRGAEPGERAEFAFAITPTPAPS